jgi:hypothetical protein
MRRQIIVAYQASAIRVSMAMAAGARVADLSSRQPSATALGNNWQCVMSRSLS